MSGMTSTPEAQAYPSPDRPVISALEAIRTTPVENSMYARLYGCFRRSDATAIAYDWDTRAPWMSLLDDIRDHYSIRCGVDVPQETGAPIIYTSLQEWHLDQVHDLLTRTFWGGIDISDSLLCQPELSTVIATYKLLVIGVAILRSPQETYITYLTVKPGWDNSQIATTMLYHLIKLNPGKDITLHVSANNPAMLLYNRFGFKAEGFVVGFYDKYLDTQSRLSKNAFLLRLRQ